MTKLFTSASAKGATRLSICVAIACIATSGVAKAASTLFGITSPVSGSSQFIQVNTSTGLATSLFSFPISSTPFAMAYDTPAGKFAVVSGTVTGSGISSPQLTLIDPVTHGTTSVPMTGFPSGQETAQGIEFDPTLGSLLVTFGAVNSFIQNRIAGVGLNGAVSQVSTTLNLPDADYLAFDPNANGLRIVDLNDDGVYAVSNVFGSPVLTQLAPNPGNTNFEDPAYSDGGQLFVPLGSNLYTLSGSSYVPVGSFGTSSDVLGLAFGPVPEPSSLAIFGACGLFLLRRRQRATQITSCA